MKKFYKNLVRTTLGLLAIGFSFSSYGQITSYPYTEGFDGAAIPSGWTQEYESGTTDWEIVNANGSGSVTPRSGSGMAEFRVSNFGNITKLVTPQLDITSLTTPQLSFYFANEEWVGDVDELRIYYKAAATDAWTQIGTDYTTGHASWTRVELILPSSSSDYYIAFEGTSNFARGLDIDDVIIGEAPTCIQPIDLTIDGATDQTADISWTPGGSEGQWNISWGTPGYTPGGANEIGTDNASSNSYQITGLIAETDYDVYVQADCGGGDESSWAGPLDIYTGYCSVSTSYASDYLSSVVSNGAVTDVSYSATTQPAGSYANETAQTFEAYEGQVFDLVTDYQGGTNSVKVWVDWGNGFSFNSGDEVASGNASSDQTFSITVPSGTPNGEYRMRVRGMYDYSGGGNLPPCGEVNYGSTVDFTLTIVDPPTCLQPTDLMTTGVTDQTADITWTAGATESSWDISWGTPGFTPGDANEIGTEIGATTNAFQITGLTDNTSYDVYVRADCGGGDESAWTGPLSISTVCIATTIPFTQDFEAVTTPAIPDCGSLENTGVGNDWKTTSSVSGFTGNVLNYSYHSSPGAANSWYFTQGIQLEVGVTYTISYKYGNNTTYYTESMKVAYGLSANELGMTDQLADYPSIELSTPAEEEINFTVSADGVYYFGFNVYSATNQNQLYVDDIHIDLAPSCLQPTDLMTTGVTDQTADITWTAGATESSWDISWGTPGFTPGDANEIGTEIGATTNAFQITGLTDNTSYDVYVRADCGGGDESAWTGPLSFSTACIATTIPFTQDFEAVTTPAIPDCGSLENTGIGNDWKTTSYASGFTGNVLNYSYHLSSGVANSWYFTQGIELQAGESYDISYVYGNNSSSYTESMMVTYGTSPIESGVLDTLGDYPSIQTASGEPVEEKITFTVPSDGVYYFGFKSYSVENQNQLYVDDIFIDLTPTCPQPTDLMTTAMSESTVDISWTAGNTESAWNISWGPTGYTPGDANEIGTDNAATNSYQITGLTADTDYDVYVQADCGSGDESSWTGPLDVYTGYCTPTGASNNSDEIVNFTLSNLNNNSVMSDGVDGYSDFTASVAPAELDQGSSYVAQLTSGSGSGNHGAALWIDYNNDLEFDSTELVATIPNSIGGGSTVDFPDFSVPTTVSPGQYRLRVQYSYNKDGADMDPCSVSTYSETEDYMVDIMSSGATCPEPTALVTTAIADQTADVTWTAGGSEAEWNVSWGTPGYTPGDANEVGTEIGVITNAYQITGLTPETDYDVYVQADCGGDQSSWTGPLFFTTGSCITVSAGVGSSIDTCEAISFDLSTLLSGNPDAGGDWYDFDGNILPGSTITTPTIHAPYNYQYIVSNGVCPGDTATVEIVVIDCGLGLGEEKSFTNISVYPNPAQNQINITNPSTTSNLKVKIVDMNGRVVLIDNNVLNNSSKATIAIDQLAKGIYTLHIYNNEGQKTFKVVKQ